MKTLLQRCFLSALSALALAGGLVACSRIEPAVERAHRGTFDTPLSLSQALARQAAHDAALAAAQAQQARSELAHGDLAPASTVAQDAAISAAIEASLRRDPDLQQHPIAVHTARRMVWLRGTVPSPDTKAHAEAVARLSAGVLGVQNRLDVQSAQR